MAPVPGSRDPGTGRTGGEGGMTKSELIEIITKLPNRTDSDVVIPFQKRFLPK